MHDECGHEHERQVVDDVVELRAVEVRRALLDACQARERPVNGIDHRGRRQPEKGPPEVAADGAVSARYASSAPLAVKRMDEPGTNH